MKSEDGEKDEVSKCPLNGSATYITGGFLKFGCLPVRMIEINVS